MPLSLLSPQSYLSSSSGKGEPDDLHLPLHRRTLAIIGSGDEGGGSDLGRAGSERMGLVGLQARRRTVRWHAVRTLPAESAPRRTAMAAFRFDPAATPESNLDAFWIHLKTITPEFAELLEKNVDRMLPLPEAKGNDRTELRVKFNSAIAKELDSSVPPKQG